MANRHAYDEEDNLIDWSAFDESAAPVAEPDGSRQLRIISVVLLLIAIAGVVIGAMEFNSVLGSASGSSGGDALVAANAGSFAKPALLVFFGLITFIPAAFGFQTAKSPVVFVMPTVLGLAGIVLSALCMIGALVIGALAGSFDPILPTYMLICTLLAAAYLFFVVRVHKSVNNAGGAPVRKRPTKEELWDEDKIWQ